MDVYRKELQVRWADLDSNAHVRHSVYYDWGAYIRVLFLSENGLTPQRMLALGVGPILFREECVFKREIFSEDDLCIELYLKSARKDFSRFSFLHTIIKNNEIIAAILTVDGAWMDTARRKLCTPPPEVAAAFKNIPLAPEFEWSPGSI